ncbi:hypothetical protein N656DRAFT_265845 [Canariomyces notabilis]|uniref:Uncharacterized protein n=1 Tax=Canariomyces notabilis TaxID=2074819 RepID=A0AAN6YX18_9PEZI|nr:hypothetical protein N656DRAFT_265845 [Canariomyces arenarius]
MEAQARLRPDLRPAWTARDQHYYEHPRASAFAACSPLHSTTSFRQDSLPSIMHPALAGYDQSMRMHERAIVDNLDERGRLGDQRTSATARSVSPMSEQTLDARRASIAGLPPPRLFSTSGPSPRSSGFFMQYHRRPTIVEETRSMLLAGTRDEWPRSHASPTSPTAGRRTSLPSFPTARRSSQQTRQELQAWGHIYFFNGSKAARFVTAVALPPEEGEGIKPKVLERRNSLTIRAQIRPCELGRPPFLLQRTFDLDKLRATIPELPPDPIGARRPSADSSSRSSVSAARRRSSPDLDKSPLRGANTVPIHLRYARAFFPALAALLYSGYIKARDIIDLPLPHPEAWVQTVAYVYTGQGELTEAIEENILYLGGKV